METDKSLIPITAEKERFENTLSYSQRIMFSAKFGDGKSFFLDNFFEERKEEFYCIKIYPVNYQVENNEDIFEYIKKDILIQLFANDDVINDIEIDYLFFAQNYLLTHGGDIVLDLLKVIPGIKIPAEFLQNIIKRLQKFEQARQKSTTTNNDKVEAYLRNFATQKGICEFDSISELITRCINKIKESTKQTVLIIEDLDRMDPAHIFRILNIISAHIDRINILPDEGECNQQNNKFNFDKIIVVCDYQNIKQIFHHFYGPITDFEGYINKFSPNRPFSYSLKNNVRKYINSRLAEIFKLPNYEDAPIKYLEEELSKITIRKCINVLNDLEIQIKQQYIPWGEYKISTVSPLSLFYVLFNRLGINISQSLSIVKKIAENPETITKIIGVNWLLIYKGELDKLWLPANDSPNCGQHLGVSIQLQIEENIIQSLEFNDVTLNEYHIINGFRIMQKKLKPYIKS